MSKDDFEYLQDDIEEYDNGLINTDLEALEDEDEDDYLEDEFLNEEEDDEIWDDEFPDGENDNGDMNEDLLEDE